MSATARARRKPSYHYSLKTDVELTRIRATMVQRIEAIDVEIFRRKILSRPDAEKLVAAGLANMVARLSVR